MTTTDQQSPDGYGVRPVKQAIYIEQAGNLLSPFHDIPLRVANGGGELHMVVEIPRWTNAKFEVSFDCHEHGRIVSQQSRYREMRSLTP